MVEEGFVRLIQAGLPGALKVPGGFASELQPKDLIGDGPHQSVMAWTYRSVGSTPNYTLGGQDGFTAWDVRIDCHGTTYANACKLARAIDAVLRGGYSGVLPDDDLTVVQGIFRTPLQEDGFSDVNRSWVRTVEYEVLYNQT